MRNPGDIRYINMLDDFYWSAYNQGVAVGSTRNAFGYSSVSYNQEQNNELYTIFDTGTSSINFSALYFDHFIEEIFEYVGGDDYEVIQGYVVSKCYGNFPSLFFMFDYKWIEVKPNEYVKDISERQDLSQCLLMVVAS